MSLALKLREGTAEKHAETEKVPYLIATFRGKIDPQTYTLQLECFYHIYKVMEEEFTKQKSHPILSKIYFPEIFRTKAIEEDIAFYESKKGTKRSGTISPKTQSYIDHILRVSKENPTMLLAQSYVRYLGDLSGGQVLKKIIAKTFALESADGLAFYEFPALEDFQAFKEKYRSLMNEMPLTDAEQSELVEEAKSVFDLNKDLFVELESKVPQNN